ncbi:MAG: hypothetical protein ACO1QR_08510 [Chthoniobacteraceae bacterium]
MNEVIDAFVNRLPMFTYCGIGQENKFTALVSLISGFQMGLAKAGCSTSSDELIPAGFVDRVGRQYGVSLVSVAEAFKEIANREGSEERAYQRLVQLLNGV